MACSFQRCTSWQKKFAQLSVQSTATANDVVASLREYVATGSVIYYPLVCRIIDAVRAAFDYLAVHAHLNRDATA